MRLAVIACMAAIAPTVPGALAQAPDAGSPPAPVSTPGGAVPSNPSAAQVSPPAPEKVDKGLRADAPPPPPPAPPGRFAFNPVTGGLLRLDSQTGQITFCRAHVVGWSCQPVPEDRAALEKQIDQLQAEVAALKAQIATLKEPPPRPPAPVPNNSEKKMQLLTDEDVARARAYMEDTWRRLVDMLMNFQKDVMRKT